MTYDKYTHMMTLIVNSHKMYENDNVKENETERIRNDNSDNDGDDRRTQRKSVNETMIVCERTVNDQQRSRISFFA